MPPHRAYTAAQGSPARPLPVPHPLGTPSQEEGPPRRRLSRVPLPAHARRRGERRRSRPPRGPSPLPCGPAPSRESAARRGGPCRPAPATPPRRGWRGDAAPVPQAPARPLSPGHRGGDARRRGGVGGKMSPDAHAHRALQRSVTRALQQHQELGSRSHRLLFPRQARARGGALPSALAGARAPSLAPSVAPAARCPAYATPRCQLLPRRSPPSARAPSASRAPSPQSAGGSVKRRRVPASVSAPRCPPVLPSPSPPRRSPRRLPAPGTLGDGSVGPASGAGTRVRGCGGRAGAAAAGKRVPSRDRAAPGSAPHPSPGPGAAAVATPALLSNRRRQDGGGGEGAGPPPCAGVPVGSLTRGAPVGPEAAGERGGGPAPCGGKGGRGLAGG